MRTRHMVHVVNSLRGGIGVVVSNIIGSISKETLDSSAALLEKRNRYNITDYIEFAQTIKNMSNKVDLFHIHGAWYFHLAAFRNKSNIPVLISPHGAFDKKSLQKSKVKKFIATYLFMKQAHINAACIHALTKKEAEDIRDYGVTNVPIAIIPNGIDISEELKLNNAFKDKLLKLASNRKIILSLSRLHAGKGIDILIDAFRKFNESDAEAVIFIAGKGDQKYTNHLITKIRTYDLETKVFLLGEQTGENKNTLYDMADIFVLPSFNEGFPLTILEAYRQKTPVITTTATPFPEIAGKRCGWYVEPTVEELYQALTFSTKLEKKALEEMGRRGCEWVDENYSSKVIGTMYLKLYLWLLGEEKKPDFIIDKEGKV